MSILLALFFKANEMVHFIHKVLNKYLLLNVAFTFAINFIDKQVVITYYLC